MTVKQLSIFLENKPGTLSTPCRLLANAGINIQTFALADTQQYGILRLIVRDPERAKELLEKDGFVVKVTEVVALEVDDKPGGLAGVLEALEASKVNIEYVYAFTEKLSGKGLLIFRFNDPDAAVKTLQGKNISIISTTQLFQRLTNSPH